MKTYIEAITQQGDVISERVVTTEEDAISSINSQKEDGKVYTLRRHICYHEEGKPCVIEQI